ncbi:MAG: 50S ribosomal protein L11 methyltransferase, partial [Thermodesulfobacteriota bacterium]
QELQAKVEARFEELASIFQVEQPRLNWERLDDQDWSSSWKEHFRPFAITDGLVIAPTWEEYQAGEGEQLLVMDPGMAFGTGHHATTSLSLHCIRELLAKTPQASVLDVGTGTGILGMGAALFGAGRVMGIDNDPEAVRAARENVELNGLEDRMEVSLTPLHELQESFELIAANIIHDVLITMVDDLWRLTKAGGHLVLSGILGGEQEKNIIRVFAEKGFFYSETARKEEWVALHFSKGDGKEE